MKIVPISAFWVDFGCVRNAEPVSCHSQSSGDANVIVIMVDDLFPPGQHLVLSLQTEVDYKHTCANFNHGCLFGAKVE